jgi:hypothetical protein
MAELVAALIGGSGITSTTFYSQVTLLAPFIVLLVPISFGLYELRKMIKGSAKGKVKF